MTMKTTPTFLCVIVPPPSCHCYVLLVQGVCLVILLGWVEREWVHSQHRAVAVLGQDPLLGTVLMPQVNRKLGVYLSVPV